MGYTGPVPIGGRIRVMDPADPRHIPGRTHAVVVGYDRPSMGMAGMVKVRACTDDGFEFTYDIGVDWIYNPDTGEIRPRP